MCGFHSSTAWRIMPRSCCTPSGRTSCPISRSVLTTSYSVFHSTVPRSTPLAFSGGTSSSCTSTSTRSDFITPPDDGRCVGNSLSAPSGE